jgi:hypothetical protein
MITANGRSLAQVDADNLAALRREITRQEGLERQRQACIRRERARRKAKFIMPPRAVSAAARIDKTRLMGRR